VYQSVTLISHWDIYIYLSLIHGVTLYPKIQKIAIFSTRIIGKWLILIYRRSITRLPLLPGLTRTTLHRSIQSIPNNDLGTYWDYLGLPYTRINSVYLKQPSQRSHGRITILSYLDQLNPLDLTDPTDLADLSLTSGTMWCRVSLSTLCGVHLRPNDGKDQSLYFINFITK